jgi:hypothetical protein
MRLLNPLAFGLVVGVNGFACPHVGGSTTIRSPYLGDLPLAPWHLTQLSVNEEIGLQRARTGQTFTARRLARRPHIFRLDGLLTAAECDMIADRAVANGMHPAETAGRTSARKRCDVALISPDSSPLVDALSADVAEVLLTEEARGGCEDLHVLRYERDGSFALHYDASPSNPRCCTVLYYLNDCGATWFPLADAEREPRDADEMSEWLSGLVPLEDGLHVAARKGDALAFYNFAEGGPDPLALHAGLAAPATRWVASHFFHTTRSRSQ